MQSQTLAKLQHVNPQLADAREALNEARIDVLEEAWALRSSTVGQRAEDWHRWDHLRTTGATWRLTMNICEPEIT